MKMKIVLFFVAFICWMNCVFSVELGDESVQSWTQDNEDTLLISAAKGHRIKVTVNELSVDGSLGEYVVIKSGETLEDPGTGRVLTYHISSPRTYIIDSNKALLHFNRASLKSFSSASFFSLNYQRIGEEDAATTNIPSTTIALPTAKPEQKTTITVYIGGKHYSKFNEASEQLNLRRRIAYMADNYCRTNNMQPNSTVSEHNVLLKELRRCPYTYPNRDYCVVLTFAVPVFVQPIFEYQLNTSHLEQMWKRTANDFLDGGMEMYEMPNNKKATTWWAVLSCIVLISIVLASFLIKYIAIKSYKKVKRRLSDSKDIIVHRSTFSDITLGPDPLQETPEFYETRYPVYEPGTPNLRSATVADNDDFEFEDTVFEFNQPADDSAEINC